MGLTAFNIRAAKGKGKIVMDLLSDSHIVEICETWMCPGDVHTARILQECSTAASTHKGKDATVALLSLYTPPSYMNWAINTLRRPAKYIIVRVCGLHITILYLSPAEPVQTKVIAMNIITQMTRGSSLIMGDINIRFC